LIKNSAERAEVTIVDLVKFENRNVDFFRVIGVILLDKESNAVEDTKVRVAEIIDKNNVVSRFEQLEGRMGADIPKTPSYENIVIFRGIILDRNKGKWEFEIGSRRTGT
jgi:hypothetical protein